MLEEHFQILGNDTLSSRQQCKERHLRLDTTLIAPFYSHMPNHRAHSHSLKLAPSPSLRCRTRYHGSMQTKIAAANMSKAPKQPLLCIGTDH